MIDLDYADEVVISGNNFSNAYGEPSDGYVQNSNPGDVVIVGNSPASVNDEAGSTMEFASLSEALAGMESAKAVAPDVLIDTLRSTPHL